MHMRQLAAKFLRRIHFPPRRFSSSCEITISNALPNSLSGKTKCSYNYGSERSRWRMNFRDRYLWTILAGQAAIILGINANPVLADKPRESSSQDGFNTDDMSGFRKIEDGSVISNEHTAKWRLFSDKGREVFLQGKLDQAEKFFFSALQEAKVGFGEKDPHVASSCNNLAELFRVQKQFDKAEPLYWEAIKILEESFGPEDIRVGAALHNLGQFYLMQRKLDEADKCYERAVKIKRRVLGLNHTDYADTLYHLGTVLYLLGKEKDAEAIIQESIKILEENGMGDSITCIRRLQFLSQMYLKSNRLSEAEDVQRKVMQIMELSKGWNSMDTVIVAERLALTLQSIGKIKEAKELLERCLEARKSLLPKDHIQIAANLLHIARVAMLNSNRMRKINISEAIAEVDKAKDILHSSTRIARQVLNKLRVQKGKKQKNEASEMKREGHAALVILLQSLDALGLAETAKQELLELQGEHLPHVEAENVLLQCISSYKEFEAEKLISDSPKVKTEYLSCLRHLLSLMIDAGSKDKVTLKDLDDEIKHVEGEISDHSKHKP
ncbi:TETRATRICOPEPTIDE REPEAT (TPR)-LIKE SUPERFAMILY PROTEIN [Salix koriyanagi]|uniref:TETRATRICOPEPTIDE REPEAT (TPR)-LIKE SUPERFAMILY PROTEIN n=1 Tax=Salix koriyanagi TaxID=2511006 RepID=A0A9Q0ZLC6_9ROSI|nr:TETRATRICOPEPTIDE REPEAT (TPR)-LIKE SUPERFAMILY PROTEIN [Salix koriyanagi]